MTIQFNNPRVRSRFSVGDRVRVHITTLYKKPPYETIEGKVYLVRAEFPLFYTTEPNHVQTIEDVAFRYGVQPDTAQFAAMKDVENELYDLTEDYLEEI
ncbi:MAG: hypothetical protein EAZ70_13240 [Runella slithyformis]|jgi:hypothetical protein|nr:MAG: hypothetical protein EAZ70_13240 [Runella slithyformis]TAF43352.1 MAG: hypothetical protein EAZ63_13920 [Runella slithyformis]